MSYTLPLTPTPNGLDYSGLSTSHTIIAWAYLEIATILTCNVKANMLFFTVAITFLMKFWVWAGMLSLCLSLIFKQDFKNKVRLDLD